MLAAHGQENLVHHQHTQAGKQPGSRLQPKTPGARYPKTPLKIPLNDENAPHAVGGGKSILAPRPRGTGAENIMTISKADKGNFVTPSGEKLQQHAWQTTPLTSRPAETRTRAPLGNKTTNAKARTGHGVVVKEVVKQIEQTQLKPTTVRPPRQRSPQRETKKLSVHSGDDEVTTAATARAAAPEEEEPDVEFAPERVPDLPYVSDVWPAGTLSLECLKPEHRFRGYYQHYFDPVDDDGVPRSDRRLEKEKREVFERGQREAARALDEDPNLNFSVSPKKTKPVTDPIKRRQPPTIASRSAASALSMAPQSLAPTKATSTSAGTDPTKRPSAMGPPKKIGFLQLPSRQQPEAKKPLPTTATGPSVAASRSTIGYTKGRSVLQGAASGPAATERRPERRQPGPLPRTLSTASSGSDTTITPERFAEENSKEEDLRRRLGFLSIFEPKEEEDEDILATLGRRGSCDDEGEEDEEFELKLEE